MSMQPVAQRDPLVEFKNEAFRMFEELKLAIQHYTVDALLKLMRNELTLTLQQPEPQRKMPRNVRTNADDIAKASGQAKNDGTGEQTKGLNGRRSGSSPRAGGRAAASANPPSPRPSAPAKVGRNDPCPCGSGKKYKKCHGA